MIQFKTIALEDRPWITKLLAEENSNSCENSFANMYMWNETTSMEAAEVHGKLVLKYLSRGTAYYGFPLGGGDTKAAVESLRADAAARGVDFKMRGVTEKDIIALETLFPGQFVSEPEEAGADYIYSAEKLSTMSGKKLHSKRNHINRFLKDNPGWVFQEISAGNLAECREMAEKWYALQNEDSAEGEHKAMERAFGNFDALQLEGGLIRAGGKIVAFAVGGQLNADTYVVHFEKAFADIHGAYSIITQEFSRRIIENRPAILYINREDDMGIESLRKAKRSLYPEFMLEKHKVYPRG